MNTNLILRSLIRLLFILIVLVLFKVELNLYLIILLFISNVIAELIYPIIESKWKPLSKQTKIYILVGFLGLLFGIFFNPFNL